MKKTMKWCALGLAAISCTAFIGCKEEENTKAETTISEVCTAVRRMYAAGYTDMNFWYVRASAIEISDDGSVGTVTAGNYEGDDIYARLYASESEAKRECEVFNEGNDKDFVLYGKWVLDGTSQAIEDFCSSTTPTVSLEIVDVFEKVCYSDMGGIVEAEIVENCGSIVVESEIYDLEAELFASESEAKSAVSGIDDCILKGKWVIWSKNQAWIDEFVKFLK